MTQAIPSIDAQTPEAAESTAQDSSTASFDATSLDATGLNATGPNATDGAQSAERGILMSEAALAHVMALRDKQGSDLCLRVGVRQGGCSGMLGEIFSIPCEYNTSRRIY